MADYRLAEFGGIVIRVADNANIPPDPANPDFRDYQAWVAAGNEPDPFVPEPPAAPKP